MLTPLVSLILGAGLFGLPLYLILGGIAYLCLTLVSGLDGAILIQEVYRLAQAPVLATLPLFIFAGSLLAESGMPRRLVEVSNALFGFLPGGLAIVTLVSCAIFTAFTGASGATILAVGGLLYPALIKAGYSERFALGLVTTSGSLGLLFAPSLPIIVYGLISQTDVTELFKAGVIPGILLVVILALYSMFVAIKQGIPTQKPNVSMIRQALTEARYELPLPFVVLGGIYGGFVTVLEAAVITAAYAIVAEVFLYREVPVRRLWNIIVDAMVITGALFVILGLALGLTNFFVYEMYPQRLLAFSQGYLASRTSFLFALVFFLLIVGCLLDIFSAIVVVVPLIVPIAQAFHVHPVHLGIVFLTCMEVGYLTPPVGINLFLSSYKFQRPLARIYAFSVPFQVLLLLALSLIVVVPSLSLLLL
jgi:tripartite ATP-independent transporter DctM subunit